jgi:hypothetical protein
VTHPRRAGRNQGIRKACDGPQDDHESPPPGLANPRGTRYPACVNVILFGATGMVGQAVLRECLRDDGVKRVLAVGRTSTGLTHPKLREHIRQDLFDADPASGELHGYDACFFCLGVSSADMSEPEYTRLTYEIVKQEEQDNRSRPVA